MGKIKHKIHVKPVRKNSFSSFLRKEEKLVERIDRKMEIKGKGNFLFHQEENSIGRVWSF